MIIIIEAFSLGGRRSEPGIAERWIEAACHTEQIEKVVVITSNPRPARHAKELIVTCVLSQQFGALYRLTNWLPRGLKSRVQNLIYLLGYMLWLNAAARKADQVALNESIALAMHVSFSSLITGTNLQRLHSRGVTTALCGGWPVPSPEGFHKYQPPAERLFRLAGTLMIWLTQSRRRTNVILAANQASIDSLKCWHPKLEWLCVPEAMYPIKSMGEEKKEQVLYFDSPHPRKGGYLLRQSLLKAGGSPILLRILSKTPESWAGIRNVVATELLSEAEYEKELSQTMFILSTSWRESGSSNIIGAASAGAIPIVTPIAAFKSLPSCAKVEIDAAGCLETNILAALSTASTLTMEQKVDLSANAASWASHITDCNRLVKVIERLLDEFN